MPQYAKQYFNISCHIFILGDTASSLGSAMDELMRHQPSLRTDATKAIIRVCGIGFYVIISMSNVMLILSCFYWFVKMMAICSFKADPHIIPSAFGRGLCNGERSTFHLPEATAKA